MSAEVAIRVEKLGKRYRLRHEAGGPRYRTLREDLKSAPRAMWRWLRQRRSAREEFWALRDVSFEVRRGEVLGVIGRNGAGKSTLLKVLSRIVEPTTGAVDLYGRVGSLLEVGTGFHPELTGRENIYLSGALLGMRRHEVRARFDEIVAFAEVERFLDTPCKHYSSGMYTRLGFAVAAHLGAEILLVDEVLAVGDAEFQRRCLGKMGEVAQSGRTVLFVSHNLGAVQQLCGRVIVLAGGSIALNGPSSLACESYRTGGGSKGWQQSLDEQLKALPPDEICEIESVRIRQDGTCPEVFDDSRPIEIEIGYNVRKAVVGLRVYFDVISLDGVVLARSYHDERCEVVAAVPPGRYSVSARVLTPFFAPRSYEIRVRAAVFNERTCQRDGVGAVVEFVNGLRWNRAYPGQVWRAAVRAPVEWSTPSATATS